MHRTEVSTLKVEGLKAEFALENCIEIFILLKLGRLKSSPALPSDARACVNINGKCFGDFLQRSDVVPRLLFEYFSSTFDSFLLA